jgi:hypothetical protein
VPAMGKITCKFKDETKTSIPFSDMVATEPNACYLKKELNVSATNKGACVLQATSSKKSC